MDRPWVILDRRYGDSVRDPSASQLAAAIRELYHEDLSGMTEADYEEHGDATLRYGYDDGPMYVVEITRGGTVTFEEWGDQDYERPLAPPREMHSVSERMSLQLWEWLARGEIEKVRSHAWSIS